MITRTAQNMQIQDRDLTQREPEDGGGFVSPSRLARHWDVHINTIYRDIRKGALPAHRLPGGRFRIAFSDARRYGRPAE